MPYHCLPAHPCREQKEVKDISYHDPPCPGNWGWSQSCTVTEPHQRGHSELPHEGLSLQTAKERAEDSEHPWEQDVGTTTHRTAGPFHMCLAPRPPLCGCPPLWARRSFGDWARDPGVRCSPRSLC